MDSFSIDDWTIIMRFLGFTQHDCDRVRELAEFVESQRSQTASDVNAIRDEEDAAG